ncbi:DUF1566 domain-containing protein [soil metagenome]
MKYTAMNKWMICCFFVSAVFTATAQSVSINNDGSLPDASAMLDVKSGIKGFLPPRMTYSERNAIATPALGLMIYCSNCGAGEVQVFTGLIWTNMIGGQATLPLAIGGSYGGGKVAYILQPGDPGYIAGQVHGLVAASNDQGANNPWYNGSFILTGATATALGTGNANTTVIVAAQGAGSYAAQLCSDYTVNGYTDWYLPGKDELNKLYINRVAIGAFLSTTYWSSSELNLNFAASQNFTDGSQAFSNKISGYAVRPVRSF